MGAVADARTPDSHLLAAAAARPAGSIWHAALTLAKTAAGTDAAAQGALRTALQMSGVDLADLDGTVVVHGDSPKLGMVIPTGELLAMGGQNTGDHGLYASAIAAILSDISGGEGKPAQLQQLLLSDLRSQVAAGGNRYPATMQFLSWFIVDLGLDAPQPTDATTSGTADIRFTTLQSWLLLLGVAGGLARHAATARTKTHTPAPGSSFLEPQVMAPAVDPVARNVNELADPAPCNPDGNAMNISSIAITVPVSSVADWIDKELQKLNPSTALNLGQLLGLLNSVLSLLHLIVESTAFVGTITMDGAQPLIRTKSRNLNDYTESRKLNLHAEYHLHGGQYANCLRTELNESGLDFSLPNDGPIGDANVDWTIDNPVGDDILDRPTVLQVPGGIRGQGANGAGERTTTDQGGDTDILLEGRPQHDELPPDPPPYLRTVTVVASVQVRQSTFANDLTDAVSAALAGFAAPAAIVVSIIERLHALSTAQNFQVKDWVKDYKIDATYDDGGPGYGSGMLHIKAIKCDGPEGEWSATVNGASGPVWTIGSDNKGTGPVTQSGGGPAVNWPKTAQIQFVPGTSPELNILYLGQVVPFVPVIPGHFCRNGVPIPGA